MSRLVKTAFDARPFIIGICAGMLGIVAGGVVAADPIPVWTKLQASHGVGAFEHISIESACTRTVFQADSEVVAIEIPAIPQQDTLLSDWIVISHPGWSCVRKFRYGGNENTEDLALCADPMHPNKKECYPQVETTLRHWLHAYLFGALHVKDISVDGHVYSVYWQNSWTSQHPMAGFGFIVKYEADIAGTPITFHVDVPTIGGNTGTLGYGPYVPVTQMNQWSTTGSPTGASYFVSNLKVSFRVVLLSDNPDNFINLDDVTFEPAFDLRLGTDPCKRQANECPIVDNWNASGINFKAHLNIRHAAPTCATDDVLVDMGTVIKGDFQAQNAVSASIPFEIKLTNCTAAIRRNVTYLMTAASGTSPDPVLGLVPLKVQAGDATGVDVQVLDQNQDPLPLGMAHTAYTWNRGNLPITQLEIPLYARLRRQGAAPVTAGPYEAAATVLIQYP